MFNNFFEAHGHFGLLQQVRTHPSFNVELTFGYCCVFEYCEDLKKHQNVFLYLQFLMLLIFVPAQQAQLFPSTPQRSPYVPISNAAV